MPADPYPVPRSNRNLTILAWIVVALISTLPDLAWMELTNGIPAWLTFAKMGLLALLAIAAFVWKPLRPLCAFFVAMFAFFGLQELRVRINFTLPALQSLFGGNVFDSRMQAEQTGKLAVSLAMIALLLLIGIKRRDAFLARGNLRTRIEPVRLPGFPKADSWPSFGLQWALYIAVALGCIAVLDAATQRRADAQGGATLAVHFVLCRAECLQRGSYLSSPYARNDRVCGRQQAGPVDVGLFLWHRALLWNARRHRGRPGVHIHGMDPRQGDARDPWPVLVVVDSFPSRYRDFHIPCHSLVEVITAAELAPAALRR